MTQYQGVSGSLLHYQGSGVSNDRGVYLIIDSLPEAEVLDSQVRFLKDRDALEHIRDIRQSGCVLLYDPDAESRDLKGGLFPVHNPLLHHVRETLGHTDEVHGFLLTNETDYYTVVHENQHLEDERSGIFLHAQELLSDLCSKDILSVQELRAVYVFIGEQRAFAAAGEARIARDLEPNQATTHKTSAYRELEHADINSLYLSYTAFQVNELLGKHAAESQAVYAELKSLLLHYASTDERSYLSLSRVFKDHFSAPDNS